MSIAQDSTLIATWQQLCDCFSGDPSLWAEVRLAILEPAEYLERYGSRMADTTREVSPWLALIGWLDGHGRLVHLDRGSSSVDLVHSLSALPVLAGTDLFHVDAENVPVASAVQRANTILARSFWTLLDLEVDPRLYTLALVSVEAEPRVRQLSAALGHVARMLDGSDSVGTGAVGYTRELPMLQTPRVVARRVNFGKRLLAFALDSVLLCGVLLVGDFLSDVVPGSVVDTVPVLTLALLGGYLVGLVVLVGSTGSTPGLAALGLRLERVDTGAVPGFGRAVGRGLLCAALYIPLWFIIVLVSTLVDESGRGLHDKAAGTLMIDKRRTAAIGS